MKGPDGYSEEDWLALSGIQHFSFCKRQWALIHVEQLWSENYLTTAGHLEHERAHDDEQHVDSDIASDRTVEDNFMFSGSESCHIIVPPSIIIS